MKEIYVLGTKTMVPDNAIDLSEIVDVFDGVVIPKERAGFKEAYIPVIFSKKPGSGKLKVLINKLKEQYDRIVFPTVLNPILYNALKRYGFKLKTEWSKDFNEYVEIMEWRKPRKEGNI